MEEKTYFNSSVSREDYRIIKDEAYVLGITTKQHISGIIHDYAERKRKEETRPTDSNAEAEERS